MLLFLASRFSDYLSSVHFDSTVLYLTDRCKKLIFIQINTDSVCYQPFRTSLEPNPESSVGWIALLTSLWERVAYILVTAPTYHLVTMLLKSLQQPCHKVVISSPQGGRLPCDNNKHVISFGVLYLAICNKYFVMRTPNFLLFLQHLQCILSQLLLFSPSLPACKG